MIRRHPVFTLTDHRVPYPKRFRTRVSALSNMHSPLQSTRNGLAATTTARAVWPVVHATVETACSVTSFHWLSAYRQFHLAVAVRSIPPHLLLVSSTSSFLKIISLGRQQSTGKIGRAHV